MTVEVYPAALPMAVRSIEACSFHVTVSRRLSEGPNLSTYVKGHLGSGWRDALFTLR